MNFKGSIFKPSGQRDLKINLNASPHIALFCSNERLSLQKKYMHFHEMHVFENHCRKYRSHAVK